MRGYIRTGRFGDFVNGVMAESNRIKTEEYEKEEDRKLWLMYSVMSGHGFVDKSYIDWKKEVLRPAAAKNKSGNDADLNDDGIKAIMNDLFPE